MSKAFTKESDGDDDARARRRGRPPRRLHELHHAGRAQAAERRARRACGRSTGRSSSTRSRGRPATATARRTATTSTASASCARSTAASASCPSASTARSSWTTPARPTSGSTSAPPSPSPTKSGAERTVSIVGVDELDPGARPRLVDLAHRHRAAEGVGRRRRHAAHAARPRGARDRRDPLRRAALSDAVTPVASRR